MVVTFYRKIIPEPHRGRFGGDSARLLRLRPLGQAAPDRGDYSYDFHTASIVRLVEQLDLHDATVVVQDWGGPIGLGLAVEHPGRMGRLVDP